jgi:HSP20 family protein
MTEESSFFKKLKKGMGVEGPIEETMEEEEKPKPRKKRIKKPKELKIETKPVPSAPPEPTVQKEFKVEAKKIEVNQLITEEGYTPQKKEEKKKWFEPEGQLAIDVYQTKDELVIQSAIAGVKPGNLDISMEGDVITIKGRREKLFEEEGNYFIQECYWGLFSREVILPVEVDPGRIEATMKEGILTIRIPKILRERRKKIIVKR